MLDLNFGFAQKKCRGPAILVSVVIGTAHVKALG